MKPSGYQRVLLIILPYLIVVSVFQVLGTALTGADVIAVEESGTAVQKLILAFFNGLGTFAILWVFMRYVDRRRFSDLGFQTAPGRLAEFWTGLGLAAGIMTVGFVLLLLLGQIRFMHVAFDLRELIVLVAYFTIVSVVEETLYRGYLLRNLMDSFDRYAALLISAAIFAVLHAIAPDAGLLSTAVTFLAGIMLGLSYVHTRNLWFPIGLHLGWNLFQSLYGFKVSGQDSYSPVAVEIVEPTIWNGGAYGLEASIFSILAALLVIAFIQRRFPPGSTGNSNRAQNG